MGEVKLKPCPFCGGEAELTMSFDWVAETYNFIVHCENLNCIAFGFGFVAEALFPTSEEAIKAWNEGVCKNNG